MPSGTLLGQLAMENQDVVGKSSMIGPTGPFSMAMSNTGGYHVYMNGPYLGKLFQVGMSDQEQLIWN